MKEDPKQELKEELEQRKARLDHSRSMLLCTLSLLLLAVLIVLWIVFTPPLLPMTLACIALFLLFLFFLSRASKDAADLSNILALERFEAMEELADLPATGERESLFFGEKAFCSYDKEGKADVVLSYRMIGWIRPLPKDKQHPASTVLYLADGQDRIALPALSKEDLASLQEKCKGVPCGDTEKAKHAYEEAYTSTKEENR